MNTSTDKKPETVIDFNGREQNIKSFQHSLRVDFPSFAQKDIDDYGTPFLSNITIRTSECGCEIVGNGTLQFPLTIKKCKLHE